jgi:hypothetical protein
MMNNDTYQNHKDPLAAALCSLTWVKVRAQGKVKVKAMNSEAA